MTLCRLIACCIIASSTVACGDADGTRTPACDATLRPVVFAHGFLAASDTWSLQAGRLEANGQCVERIAVFDWNTLGPNGAEAALDRFIDGVLATTGASQVDLVGHSAGGGLGYRYLADPAHAAKVAHYAHLASSSTPLEGVEPAPAGPAAAPVATLAVRSDGDTIITSAVDIPGATNVVLASADHYEVATSAESFVAMWSLFHGAAPTTTTPRTSAHPVLAGKALTLGENAPVTGWTVDVWPVTASGQRDGAAPVTSYTVASDGAWGPFEAAAGLRYELFLHGPGVDDRPIHYYIEPVTQDDRLVYLRALPSADSLVGGLLSGVPFDDRHVVLIAFSSSKAVIAGRNDLTIGARTLSTEALASAERTSIAFFVFDENVDQASGEEASTFAALITVFLTAVDEHIAADANRLCPVPREPAKRLAPVRAARKGSQKPQPTDAGASITVTLDGRALTVPRWPSGQDGAVITIFR